MVRSEQNDVPGQFILVELWRGNISLHPAWLPDNPANLVRIALQDAASVSSLLITTEAMIAEKPKDKPAAMPGGGGMGGGMGGMDF